MYLQEQRSQETQTEPLKSLPCSNCFSNDVLLHPAVAAGVVDVEFASVILNNGPADVENVKKRSHKEDA